ncbi:APC family permease [Rhodococcus sp. NPDC057529]|uniref:APC family permease n=1 Tax=Rhodococcus sp. NPDC057529 TaxID=3346158 RepID=UPI0036735EB7
MSDSDLLYHGNSSSHFACQTGPTRNAPGSSRVRQVMKGIVMSDNPPPIGVQPPSPSGTDYSQHLSRGLSLFHNVALGFGAVSPVIGLYSTAAVGLALAGASWLWVLPIALAGNCLLLYLYSELARQFPIAGGAYQWTRRLIGPRYAWFAGWFAICGLMASLTTLAYLGSPWILSLLSIEATPLRLVATAVIFNIVCALANLGGVNFLKRMLNFGVGAEFAASLLVGIALLLWFRNRPISSLWDFSTYSQLGFGSVSVSLALLAVAGWAFIGFDACIAGAEETKNSSRNVPRALWYSMLSVGGLVFLNALSIALAHPDLSHVASGEDLDPVTTSVVANFGAWSDKPFVATVVIAFIACGLAANTQVSRLIWSISRDGVLPGSTFLRRVHGNRRVPSYAILVTGILACAGLVLALNDRAIGTLVAYGTGGMYLTFSLIAIAGLVGRLSGRWKPQGSPRRRRVGLIVNVSAVAWLVFETTNIVWPRPALNPPDAQWYQLWAAPLVSAGVFVIGWAYFIVARPAAKLISVLPSADDQGFTVGDPDAPDTVVSLGTDSPASEYDPEVGTDRRSVASARE